MRPRLERSNGMERRAQVRGESHGTILIPTSQAAVYRYENRTKSRA